MSDVPPSAGPRLNYKGQTESAINADYADMPGGAQISMVDKTSGVALEGWTILDSGGSGSESFAIDASTPAGDYYLVALDAAGEEIAQSVEFYISHG